MDFFNFISFHNSCLCSFVLSCPRAIVLLFFRSFVPSCYRSFVLSFFRAIVPSCPRAIVLSCYRVIVLSFYRAIVLSFFRSIVLSCPRAIVLSCYRAIVLSFFRAIVLFGAYSSIGVKVKKQESFISCFWRRERDSNPRTRLPGSTVFETAPFDRSGISPFVILGLQK